MKYIVLQFVCLFVSLSTFAQVDLKNIVITGKVTDKTTGKGIMNVPVSDGFNIVQTDVEGSYSLITNRNADFVMLTIPTEYEVPFVNSLPDISKRIDKNLDEQQLNFTLTRLSSPEDSYRMIVYADPQVYNNDDLDKFEHSVKDIVATMQEENTPVYLMCCGDIVFDQPQLFERYKQIISTIKRPIFHTKGNHDMTLMGWSMETSPKRFREEFGPEFYSFNRGKAHYVVLDDVMFIGRGYLYIGYLSERQLNWLKQDLSLVVPGSLVVVMFHIPAWSLDHKKDPNVRGSLLDCLQNRNHLFELLKPFKAHIFSGHNHCCENYILGENLMEHIHGGFCGSWWQADICTDGSAAGYGVYTIKGNDMTWRYKGTDRDKNMQMFVYPVGIDQERPDAFVANVWNWDPEWKVRWYENGKLMGDMTQYVGLDPYADKYLKKNRANWLHTWIYPFKTEHLFYAIPASVNSKIKVEVTDRFGNVYVETVK